jgi:formiminoglutamase
MSWLEITRGDAPLLLAFPHTGTELAGLESRFRSPWLARRDADWFIDELYGFARALGATTVRTRISRSVIDVNRDPSGNSLYPGQFTTGLCPLVNFDGEPLYAGAEPDAAAIAERRARWFDPYHVALTAELARLRALHPGVVLYDAHSIRSRVPHLFDGELPQFNIGTNGGAACSAALANAVAAPSAASGLGHVVDGRFKGGWTTRHYGNPAAGIHAVQMELAIRGYLPEPAAPGPANWPPAFDPAFAAPLQAVLSQILTACLDFAKGQS